MKQTVRFRDIRLKGNRRDPMPDIIAGRIVPLDEWRGENRIQCRDGFQFSVIAGWGTYCWPRPEFGVSPEYRGPYTHVEVGFFDGKIPRNWIRKRLTEHPGHFSGATTVAAFVPVRLVYELLKRHGGEADYIGNAPMDRERHKKTTERRRRLLRRMRNATEQMRNATREMS